jgi:hypothetical protein
MKTYQAVFDENANTGVYGISLVLNPAMEGSFIALSKQEEVTFKEVSKEERKVVGLVLEPNKLIYRNDGNEEYNIVFNEETIKNLSYNFFKQKFHQNSTIEHNVEQKIENVTFVESWIVEDRKTDKQQLYGFDYPIGSWLATLKIDNPEVWENFVKTGKVKGFSIDGFLSLKEVKLSKNQTTEGVDIWFKDAMITKGVEVFQLNGEYLNNGTHELMTNVEIDVVNGVVTDLREVNLKSINMSKEVEKQTSILERILLALTPSKEVKLGAIKTADGAVTIEYEGNSLTVGSEAYIMADDETKVPVPIGEHPLEDGRVLVVTEEGIVGELKEAVAEEVVTEEMEEETITEEAKQDAEIAKEIETAIKSILIKYEKVEKELETLKTENVELKTLLSQEPAEKKINSTATQVDLSKLTPLERFRLNK